MEDHWIYSDFRPQVDHFRTIFERELEGVPNQLRPLAAYYMKKRLFIVNRNGIRFDPRVGRPVPYLALWFSDAMGLPSKKGVNELAQSLYYISIMVSVRDDLVDGRVVLSGKKASEHAHVALMNYFYHKYYEIFANLFPPKSEFWSLLLQNSDQWSSYETWGFLEKERPPPPNPLSSSYLKDTSSYLVAITFPTLAAIAMLAGKSSRIPHINKFLIAYCMGWKIADDLRDWRKDLKMENVNHSSVIHYSINFVNKEKEATSYPSAKNKPDEKLMESLFLDGSFVEPIYDAIIRNYSNARKNAALFHSAYLDAFIETQISFYREERGNLLAAPDMLITSLTEILKK